MTTPIRNQGISHPRLDQLRRYRLLQDDLRATFFHCHVEGIIEAAPQPPRTILRDSST
jgi:hypothetical protein